MTIEVIHRTDFDFGAAHDQGQRPTCLAFSLSDLNRFGHREEAMLSAEYLYRCAARAIPGWKPGDGLQIGAGLTAVCILGQPAVEHCPYAPAEPAEIPPAVPALSAPLYASPIQIAAGPAAIAAKALQRGRPLGLVVRLLTSFFLPVDGRISMSGHLVDGLHAVVATAIGRDAVSQDSLLLVRNSWGTAWGIDGSAWLPMSYVNAYTTHAFEV